MKIFKYFVLLFFPVVSTAQPNYGEQLDFIYSIRMDNTLEASRLLDQLLNNFDALNSEQKAKYYSLRAHSHVLQGNYVAAIKSTEKVVEITKSLETKLKAKSLKASALYFSGNYRASFTETYEVLDQVDKIQELNIKNDVLMNAVTNHISAGILDKAQELSLQNLASAGIHKNSDMACQSRFQLASIKQKLGQYKAAIEQAKGTLSLCINAGNHLYELVLKELIAEATLNLRDYNSAEQLYVELYEVSKDFGWLAHKASVEPRLAEAYLALKKYSKVEQYALPAYRYSKETNDYQRLKNASLVLAKFYKETGDLKKARLYNQEYRDAMVITSQQLEKSRLGYYQAMNERAKNKTKSISLALKNVNSN